MTYIPETAFQTTDDNKLVYNFKMHEWKNGAPIMINDVSIAITAPDEVRKIIAAMIQRNLNRWFDPMRGIMHG